MKVLVIGSGGREHAIAYTLNKSPKVDEIHAIPGNPGIAEIGTCHKGSTSDLEGILKFVEENNKTKSLWQQIQLNITAKKRKFAMRLI